MVDGARQYSYTLIDLAMNKSTFESYEIDQYQDVNDIAFPEEIPIAYAVCSKSCGNKEFIVDGQSQVCQYCGKLMFRTLVKEYVKKT